LYVESKVKPHMDLTLFRRKNTRNYAFFEGIVLEKFE